MEFEAMKDELPYWHFDGDAMVFDDGSMGAGFGIEGPDIGCATAEEINEIADGLENLVSGMDEGTSIQTVSKISSDYGEIIEKHANLASPPSACYEEVRRSRLGFLRSGSRDGEYLKTDVFVFLRSAPHPYPKRRFWESGRRFEATANEDYASFKKAFLKGVRRTENALAGCGLRPVRLRPKDWHALCFGYFNPGRAGKSGIPGYRKEGSSPFAPTFADQIAMSDTGHAGGTITSGRKKTAVVTLGTLPEGETRASMARTLSTLPFHLTLIQGIKMEDQRREGEKLGIRRRLAHSFASGANVGDLESESTLRHTEELARELLEGSEKVVSVDMAVVVQDDSREGLEDKTDRILGAFRDMGGSGGHREVYAAWEAFIGYAPGVCRGLRPKKAKGSNAAHLMPVYGNRRGSRRPVCLLPTREGALYSLDPFDPALPNWNALVFGGSGAGKSFTVSQLMLQFHGQEPTPKIVWIDNGASSKRLLEVLDGEFIDLGIGSPVCLNMFDPGDGRTEPTGAKTKLILAALELITKEEGATGIPKRDRALLEEAIREVYKKPDGKPPTLGDFRRLLKDHEEAAMRRYGDILYPWTGRTAFGRMLDGQTNIGLEGSLATVETKGLDGHPELQSVLLLLLTDHIKREAEEDTARPYLLIIDEAWKLFESPSGLAFTTEAFRTFRKSGGGIWCISQHYKDFLANDAIKNAVFPNTSNIFVLGQKKIDWEDFRKTMDFPPEATETAKSLRVKKGEYAEFLHVRGDERNVLRLAPDPLSYWICTSDPGDAARIEREKKRNPELPTIEVLKKIAKEDAT